MRLRAFALLGLLALAPRIADAALAINSEEANNVAHGTTGNGPVTWAFNNVAGTLLIVAVIGTGGGGTIALGVPTYNSISMTLVPSSTVTWDTAHSAAALYYLLSPATGSNTVSISFSGATGSKGLMGAAISFTGNDTSAPVGTPATATGSSTTASVNVTGTTNGNYVVDVVGNGTTITSATSPTVLSAKLNQNNFTGGDNFGMGQQATSGGTVTAKWTVGSDVWGITAVEIKAAATAVAHKFLSIGVGN